MSRSAYVGIVCNVMAVLCIIAGLVRVSEVGLAAANPAWLSTDIHCERTKCKFLNDPVNLLNRLDARAAKGDPDAAAKINARLTKQRVRVLMTLSKAFETLPIVFLYLSVAFVLRNFAKRDPFGVDAIRWLRRAAIAASLLVLAKPIAQSLWQTALMPAFEGSERWRFSIIGSDVPYDLLLAGIIWTVAWALDQGKRSRDELDQYV